MCIRDRLHRARKEGIGPAYLAGFAHAMANGADLLLEMDADFSHDPAARHISRPQDEVGPVRR